ncbi:MAG: flagellar motor switch protein FliN [Methylomarinum sp.]|nr:flagellar motor switch protein FliN [Methylococcales bacterium]NOR71437.1 flagellar motor switch protein FliN [Methylomarinum sp.]
MSEDENEEGLGDDWGAAMQEQGDAEAGADADWGDALKEQEDAEVMESAQFNELETQGEVNSSNADMSTADLKLDVILDVPVTVSMEIGRTNINIRNLLQLNQGSVIELDRFAGEPMDVLVNGTLIAHGEVVVVNDKFGIRLTDVISPTERVKKLG